MQRSDKLLTRATLFQEIWNYKFVPDSNLIDVHMGRLRRKVDGPSEAPIIRTVRGAGYVLSITPLSEDRPGGLVKNATSLAVADKSPRPMQGGLHVGQPQHPRSDGFALCRPGDLCAPTRVRGLGQARRRRRRGARHTHRHRLKLSGCLPPRTARDPRGFAVSRLRTGGRVSISRTRPLPIAAVRPAHHIRMRVAQWEQM
jgi:DNA-binding winged helix-turn-helix (wHTH) protein